MDTIQRELPHELDQVHLEVLQLRKQVAEIEKHLRSARKEGRDASGRQQLHASDAEAVGGEGPAHGGPAGTEDQEAQPPQALSVPRLQRKLKEAARKILRLRLEKEQLLELGNQLRAELGHLTGLLPVPPSIRESRKSLVTNFAAFSESWSDLSSRTFHTWCFH
ncbi:hypothetical protein J1605_003773 [Eschrichtius robustus]|uniref:Centromere protein Q n=1 Tax=Eschrichtius robustus TaxID=9764 RepID=A0AB34HN42_ESCRO|nr:hypothetical protein J1605_003773 [Eschrichtius robustus]